MGLRHQPRLPASELIEYWRTRYDWRTHERGAQSLHAFHAPNRRAAKIHFIHEHGRGPNPKPLLLLHGWPGSIYEFMEIIPMLTDPAAHGGDARDSFTVIAPSLPGYGFSAHPRTRAMNIQAHRRDLFTADDRSARLRALSRAQGGDWGSAITSRLGEVSPPASLSASISTWSRSGAAEGRRPAELTDEEKVFLGDIERFRRDETGYQWIQGTKPQTLAYGLNDSPAGLAAWIVEKFRTWSDCDGDVERRFTQGSVADQRDDLLGYADR